MGEAGGINKKDCPFEMEDSFNEGKKCLLDKGGGFMCNYPDYEKCPAYIKYKSSAGES